MNSGEVAKPAEVGRLERRAVRVRQGVGGQGGGGVGANGLEERRFDQAAGDDRLDDAGRRRGHRTARPRQMPRTRSSSSPSQACGKRDDQLYSSVTARGDARCRTCSSSR